MGVTKLIFSHQQLNLKLRLFLAGHTIAMVTYCITKIKTTCSPMIGQLFNQLIKSGYNDSSKSKSLKVQSETVPSQLELKKCCSVSGQVTFYYVGRKKKH